MKKSNINNNMIKKITVVVIALVLTFSSGIGIAEGSENVDKMIEIERTIERIEEGMAEQDLEVVTYHPETQRDEAFLAGQVENLTEPAQAYFQWGRTDKLKNQTEPKSIEREERLVEKVTDLREAGSYRARLVVESEGDTFHGPVVSFGIDKKGAKRQETPEIDAEAVYSSHYQRNRQEVSFRENGYQKRPIGGLTKLVTALVAYENYDLSTKINIPEDRLGTDERLEGFAPFEDTTVEDLLKLVLIDSHNEAAYALSVGHSDVHFDEFVSMMNEKASKLGMNDTKFYNPVGFDGLEGVNLSTARDLAYLTEEVIGNDFFEEVMQKEDFKLKSKAAEVSYGEEANHNKFISGEYYFFEGKPDWAERVIGGHSGWTAESGASLITLVEDETGRGHYINVLLGAENQDMTYTETESLMDWITLEDDERLEESDPAPHLEGDPSQEEYEESSLGDIPDDFLFEDNMARGVSGEPVKYLQIFLNNVGAKVAEPGNYGSSGMETEYYGPATEQAVAQFQEKHSEDVLEQMGLYKGTGVVGEVTREKLNEVLAK